MSDLQAYQQQVDGGGELSLYRTPEHVLEEAQRAARALTDVVRQTNAVITLGKSEHLKVEAWQTLGHFYGLAAQCPDDRTRYVDYGGVRGFEATAVLIHIGSGKKVSEATAMCLSDEERWSTRTKYEWQGDKRVAVGVEPVPLFQLRSMAQTRAISKVHGNALKWVVVLAGYSPTPAEEVESDPSSEGAGRRSGMPKRKSESGGKPSGAKTISEPQEKRMFAKAMAANLSKDDYTAWLKENGFTSSKDVTLAKYDALCKALDDSAKAESLGVSQADIPGDEI